MLRKIAARWFALATLVVVGMLALGGPDGALAAATCRKVEGKLTLQALDPSTCPSPVGLCAAGTYRGGIKGTSAFTGTSFIQTADTPATAVVIATGDNTIAAEGGTLLTKDAIVLQTVGDGHFAEVDTVIGGTGEWAGAAGTLQATGTFANGSGAGTYQGEICTP